MWEQLWLRCWGRRLRSLPWGLGVSTVCQAQEALEEVWGNERGRKANTEADSWMPLSSALTRTLGRGKNKATGVSNQRKRSGGFGLPIYLRHCHTDLLWTDWCLLTCPVHGLSMVLWLERKLGRKNVRYIQKELPSCIRSGAERLGMWVRESQGQQLKELKNEGQSSLSSLPWHISSDWPTGTPNKVEEDSEQQIPRASAFRHCHASTFKTSNSSVWLYRCYV